MRQLLFRLIALSGIAFLGCGSGGGGADEELFADEGSGGSDVSVGGAPSESGGSGSGVGGGPEQAGGSGNPTSTGGSGDETSVGGSPGTGSGGQGPVVDPTCTNAADFVACSLTTTPDRSFDICAHGLCASPGCGLRACNVPAVYFSLPGDTRSEFARTGDAEPVVTDSLTGLMWQGCVAGYSGADCSIGERLSQTYAESAAYCEELAWGGFQDWALPDIFALQSLVSYTGDPPYDEAAFPRTGSTELWASTAIFDAEESLTVLFLQGNTAPLPNSYARPVRCVRRPTPPAPLPAPRFFRTSPVAGQPVVVDSSTGLSWQGCAAGLSGDACSDGGPEMLAHEESVLYCDESTWGGFDDWRLPTIRELVSMISFAPDAYEHEQIDRQFAFATDLRSSTPSFLYGGHWQLRLHGVEMDTAQDSLPLQLVCVR